MYIGLYNLTNEIIHVYGLYNLTNEIIHVYWLV